MKLELLAAALVLTGLAMIGATLYLWLRARRHRRIILQLIAMAEAADYDPLHLLRQALPLLQRAGINGIAWELEWFGTTIKEQSGHCHGAPHRQRVITPEPALVIDFFQPRLRGEHRYFNEMTRAIFLLLLRTGMWIKTGVAHTTLTHLQKISEFAGHDLKNIAQYLQLLDEQLAREAPGAEAPGAAPPGAATPGAATPGAAFAGEPLLSRLRRTIPTLRRRAEKILHLLGHQAAVLEPPTPCALANLLRELADLHGLTAKITGAATVAAPPLLIESICDNILKNYADLATHRQPPPRLEIIITPAADFSRVEIVDIAVANQPCDYERLFEPLYSTPPPGSGLGLYQARHRVRTIGGRLAAAPDAQGRLRFELLLPTNYPPPGSPTLRQDEDADNP